MSTKAQRNVKAAVDRKKRPKESWDDQLVFALMVGMSKSDICLSHRAKMTASRITLPQFSASRRKSRAA